jgi:MFS family permease
VSEAGLRWTVDAYTLVLSCFLILGGSLADRVGRRRVFQFGLTTFGLGSLLCGVASTIGFLIAARAVQAVGGAMLNPVAAAIVATTFPEPDERARAIGVFSSMTGLSMVLGPILGGGLVERFGWHSVFWINLPIVGAALCAARFVPESRVARARRVDPVGQALIVVALGALVYAIIESRRLGWTSPGTVGLLGITALAALGIIAFEPRQVDPLLD